MVNQPMGQITTHILDTAAGKPAAGVAITLAQQDNGEWNTLGVATTCADGRAAPVDAHRVLPAGRYKLRFATADYFRANNQNCFHPWVEIVFDLAANGEHYHIPLLLSPFGYTTYRGS